MYMKFTQQAKDVAADGYPKCSLVEFKAVKSRSN